MRNVIFTGCAGNKEIRIIGLADGPDLLLLNIVLKTLTCLIDCTSIKKLPAGLPHHCDLQIRGCTSIRELPLDLTQCTGMVTDWGYSGLESLPDGFVCKSWNLKLNGCKNLRRLPGNMIVGGNLDLSYSGIEELPDGFTVSGSLNLKGCKKLTRLPANLFVDGNLLLDNEDIEELPPGLKVSGKLDISWCTKIKSLPGDLVAGDEIITDRTLDSL